MIQDVAGLPGYQVLVIFEEIVETTILSAGVREIRVVNVEGAILLIEDGDGVHEVQHVGGEALILKFHDCAALACWDADQEQEQGCNQTTPKPWAATS